MKQKDAGRDKNQGATQDAIQSTDQDEGMAALLRLAGAREAMPGETKVKLEARFREELAASRQKRRTIRFSSYLAMAAAVVLAVVVVFTGGETVPVMPLAEVVRTTGTVMTEEDGLVIVGAGDSLQAGDLVLTRNDGRALLGFLNGTVSMRLDRNTEILMLSGTDVDLRRGSIYIDTGDHGDQPRTHLTVTTAHGEITDVGTQYLIAADDASVVVSVREGSVRVVRGDLEMDGHANHVTAEQLKIATGRPIEKDRISKYGPHWAWIHEVAPGFDTHDRHIIEILEWAARETGRELKFVDARAEQWARENNLRGTITLDGPEDALATIERGTDLRAVNGNPGVIAIELRI